MKSHSWSHVAILVTIVSVYRMFEQPCILNAEPPKTDEKSRVSSAQDDDKVKIVVNQVRDETYGAEGRVSKKVDDFSAIINEKDFLSADGSYRLRLPKLGSGNLDIYRRHIEEIDTHDVKFIDNNSYWRAVFSVHRGEAIPLARLKEKYKDHLTEVKAQFEIETLKTPFGDAVQLCVMNWVSSDYYPYEEPVIDASETKIKKIGPTVGVSRFFLRDKTRYDFGMIVPTDSKSDVKKAFKFARAQMDRFAAGLQFVPKS